jgi:hypothetical protein
MEVGGERFSAPSITCTLQRAQIPIPPQELPIGAPARRAASSTVSFGRAAAEEPRGWKQTSMGLSVRGYRLAVSG